MRYGGQGPKSVLGYPGDEAIFIALKEIGVMCKKHAVIINSINTSHAAPLIYLF